MERESVRASNRELFDELRARVAELREGENWDVIEEIVARLDELEESLREDVNASYGQGVRDDRERWSHVDATHGPHGGPRR